MTHLYIPTPTETATACAHLTTRQPSEAQRYARAAALVRAGAVGHDADGWTVASEDKSHPAYRVTTTTCGCVDHVRTGARCKHLAAMTLYAHILGAKLNERLPLPPEALYLQLLARGQSHADAAAITDDYVANPAPENDPAIFTIIGSQPDQRHVYARADGAEICTVRRVVLCGGGTKWVPHTAADTLGWATWLGQEQAAERDHSDCSGVAAVAVAAAASVGRWRDWRGDPPTIYPADEDALIGSGLGAYLAADDPRRAMLRAQSAQEASPYKIDQRNAAKYGHAPVAQLQHAAAERRRAAQA